jgi:hypothetical protein
MWKIFLAVWLFSFVALVFFYIESEFRWRSKDRSQRRSQP